MPRKETLDAVLSGLSELRTRRGSASSEISIDLSELVAEKLASYAELLETWSPKVDLVAAAPAPQIVHDHLLDSAGAWVSVCANLKLDPECTILDVGSGAGLPGLVIAILSSNLQVLLCEPRLKRVNFLKEVIRKLSVRNATVVGSRVQEIDPQLVQNREVANVSITRATGLGEQFVLESGRILGNMSFAAEMVSEDQLNASKVENSAPGAFAYDVPVTAIHRGILAWKCST